MDFNNGILYVFIALFTFLIDSAVKSLTDTADSSEIFKKRMRKYSIASLAIVSLYIILYYFTTKTSKFNFTTKDGIMLLVVFCVSILYFYLNASISTLVKKWLAKKNWDQNSCWVMFGFNIVTLIIIIVFANLQLTSQNYINRDTTAVIYSKNEDTNYKVIIPKDTLFTIDYSINKPDNTSELVQMFDFQVNNSEYKIAKGTTIKLLGGTYLNYNDETSLKLIINGKLSKSDFYTNDNSIAKLNSEQEVELSEDSTVLLKQQNSYITISVFALYAQISSLIIYYPLKNQYNL
jgi:membrane protein